MHAIEDDLVAEEVTGEEFVRAPRLVSHGCGKSWRQRGEWTSHCGACHETFEGLTLFDAHRKDTADGRVCVPPADVIFHKHPLEQTESGTWRGHMDPAAFRKAS